MHDLQPQGRERGRHGEGGLSGGHQSTVTICLCRQGHILSPKPSVPSASRPVHGVCTALRAPGAQHTVPTHCARSPVGSAQPWCSSWCTVHHAGFSAHSTRRTLRTVPCAQLVIHSAQITAPSARCPIPAHGVPVPLPVPSPSHFPPSCCTALGPADRLVCRRPARGHGGALCK